MHGCTPLDDLSPRALIDHALLLCMKADHLAVEIKLTDDLQTRHALQLVFNAVVDEADYAMSRATALCTIEVAKQKASRP